MMYDVVGIVASMVVWCWCARFVTSTISCIQNISPTSLVFPTSFLLPPIGRKCVFLRIFICNFLCLSIWFSSVYTFEQWVWNRRWLGSHLGWTKGTRQRTQTLSDILSNRSLDVLFYQLCVLWDKMARNHSGEMHNMVKFYLLVPWFFHFLCLVWCGGRQINSFKKLWK